MDELSANRFMWSDAVGSLFKESLMRRTSLTACMCVLAMGLGLSLTGCGGSDENTVVENTESQPGMSQTQQNQYEEYMKQQQQRGN